MGGNAGELQLGSERELYIKYINHHAGTTKASIKIILIQVYNIFGLIIGVPAYSSKVIEINKNYKDSGRGGLTPSRPSLRVRGDVLFELSGTHELHTTYIPSVATT